MDFGSCPKEGCTVSESGICLLSHTPIATCPTYKPPEQSTDSNATAATIDAEAPTSPEPTKPRVPVPVEGERRFHTGLELGTEDAREISRSRYCHLIGILGAWDAGKTCCLLSLYLSAANGRLPNGYRFAGSLTLKGFEDRARRLRSWKRGPLPTQLADHTILGDSRQAALLHLAIRQGQTGRRVDLLLTDLPGEWSKTLVDRASTAERFSFLKRADGIILVVDGKAMESSERNVELLRTKHLLERLKSNVGVDPTVPMTLLISKGDAIKMRRPAAADELVQHARSLGFDPKVVVAAAFSYDATIPSGTGVFEAIEPLISPSDIAAAPRITPPTAARPFAMFGGSGDE